MKKALITDGVHEILIKDLEAANYTCIYKPKATQEEVEAMVHEAEILIVNSKITVDKDFINKAQKLKFIGRLGSGMEIIDIPYAESKGIKVFNSPEGNRDAVAEHAIGMLLMLFNQLHFAHNDVRSFNWNREQRRGEELLGKTVGLIGYGNTGKSMAKKLAGFDVEVLYYDKYLNEGDTPYAKQVTLTKLQKQADIISFHLPYNEETYYFFDEAFITQTAKSFYLINTSRGKIVNTTVLLESLASNKIKGACLDVFENEKVATYSTTEKEQYKRLFKAQNVVFSPHVAGWTVQSKYKLAKTLSRKILQKH